MHKLQKEKVKRSYVNAVKDKVLVFKSESFQELETIMTIEEWMEWVDYEEEQKKL